MEFPGPLLGAGPPAKMKVFAFNGDTMEVMCWVGIRRIVQYPQLTELFIVHEDGQMEVLNKKVVIQNLETGTIIYDPRTIPRHFQGQVFITASETQWLKDNPHWPGVLELYDHPVEGREDEDGLRA